MNVSCFSRRAAFVIALCALALASSMGPARAALPPAKRAVLAHYLDALAAGKYQAAFALLSTREQHYFSTAANFGSIFTADRLKIESYKIVGSTNAGNDTVAIVSQRVEFFDHAHQALAAATAKVPYGIVPDRGGFAIKDPYHPWRAFAPNGWTASANGLNVTVRKISFFTGRVELLLSFENRGDATVSILPYGRTVVRDDAGHAHAPIATKLAALTDKTLYTGLRLAPSGRYTGAMTFFTPDRFTPKTLAATLAPILADGADAPFEIELPALDVTR